MFILGTRKSETAPNIAFHLKNCEGGYRLPDNEDFVINYGRRGCRSFVDLNGRIINNKYIQLIKLRENDIRVPNHRLIDTYSFYSVPRYSFPWIARKYYHARGSDAIFLKTKGSMRKRRRRVLKRHYIVKYIPKKTEFRVHILGEGMGGISTKIKHEESYKHHPHIWSRERGWIQIDYNGELNETLKEIAIKSCKVLGYDFGAVDIILGRDNRLYVLEINSAPRLNRRRRKIYAKYFRKEWKNKARR